MITVGVPPCPVGYKQCLGLLETVLCKCARCQGSAQGGLKVFCPFHLLGILMCCMQCHSIVVRLKVLSVTYLLLILASSKDPAGRSCFGGCSGWGIPHIYTAV